MNILVAIIVFSLLILFHELGHLKQEYEEFNEEFREVIDIEKYLDDNEEVEAKAVGLLSMAMITLGNGADNIGVYIPLFTGFSSAERIGAVIVFVCLTALWVFLANTLAEFPKVKSVIEKYKTIAIPVVFIALGVFIILDSGLIGQEKLLRSSQQLFHSYFLTLSR